MKAGGTVQSAKQVAKTRTGVTARAVLLALLLAVANDYWIVQIEVVRYSFATYAAPFYNCVFTLFVLTMVNFAVRRRFPRIALTRVELITVYVMLSISSAVCSHNMMEVLVSLMGYAHVFKTPENNWGTLFADRLPRWLTVSDRTSLHNFYYGGSSIYRPENLLPWLVPVLAWSAFCCVLLLTMLCLNSILRKQWVESERLTFPVVVLPLEMTTESGELFRNRRMWMGFAVAGAITLLAGLHDMYPAIPYIRIVRHNYGPLIALRPWNAIGSLYIGFYFWAIGIAFLMPLELSFSCWALFWLMKLELVACSVTGLGGITSPAGGFDRAYPYVQSQAWGAYVGYFTMTMWAGRHYLMRVFRTAFMGTKEEDESREAISYRTAILGALAGFVFLGLFARAAGMSPPVILVFLLLYFVFAVIVSRIRAELGFPTHDMQLMGPQHAILTAVGTEKLGVQNLSALSLFSWFNRTYASHPSPHQLESFKLAEGIHLPARQIFVAAAIASVFAMPIGFWMLLNMYFHNGGATANVEQWALGLGRECWTNLENWINRPFATNGTSMGFVMVGFVVSGTAGLDAHAISMVSISPARLRDSAELGRCTALDAALDRLYREVSGP